jgi:hypothetical protein
LAERAIAKKGLSYSRTGRKATFPSPLLKPGGWPGLFVEVQPWGGERGAFGNCRYTTGTGRCGYRRFLGMRSIVGNAMIFAKGAEINGKNYHGVINRHSIRSMKIPASDTDCRTSARAGRASRLY